MPTASIVIRTRNEARLLGTVLEAVFAQRRTEFEVLVVDSGSSDGTLAIARSFPARVLEIPPASFSFGRALNLGAGHAEGDVVVSLAGHAVPTDDRWLEALLRPFAEDPRCAGAYGRQVGSRDANPFEASALDAFYGAAARVQEDDPRFSNANGAVRRNLWQAHPFDEEVSSAEDALWAHRLQREGYRIRYVPEAAVTHYHDEGFRGVAARRFREARVLVRLPGYASSRPSLWSVLTGPVRILARVVRQMAREGIPPNRLLQGLAWHLGYWWGDLKARREAASGGADR